MPSGFQRAAAVFVLGLSACAGQTPYQAGYAQGCRIGQSYSGAPAISVPAGEGRGEGEQARGFDDGVKACYGNSEAYARAARGTGR